jgi:hypothetical protein
VQLGLRPAEIYGLVAGNGIRMAVLPGYLE